MFTREFIVGVGVGLTLAVTPAFADVFVTAWSIKDKDVTVAETVTKNKLISINVLADPLHDGAAEAAAIGNIRNEYNEVGDVQPITKSASTYNSVNNDVGIT